MVNKKKEIIEKIDQEKKGYLKLSISLIFIVSILIFSLFFNQKKNKKNKEKLDNLLNNTKEVKNKVIETENIGIKQEIVDDILLKLKEFELKNEFINELSMTGLSKKFKTNSKYLSKIINHNKNKNFSNYINDLRIDYAIHKLKNDETFRKFTIKAISNEVGFKSAESFSTAFYKNTGIKPSYFIKNLSK